MIMLKNVSNKISFLDCLLSFNAYPHCYSTTCLPCVKVPHSPLKSVLSGVFTSVLAERVKTKGEKPFNILNTLNKGFGTKQCKCINISAKLEND